MALHCYHCRECNEAHEAEIWYSRDVAPGLCEYVCSPKFKRSDLNSGWALLPIPD